MNTPQPESLSSLISSHVQLYSCLGGSDRELINAAHAYIRVDEIGAMNTNTLWQSTGAVILDDLILKLEPLVDAYGHNYIG